MGSSPVKIAIIGTGLIGPRHAQAVLNEPDAILSCIVDPSPAAEAIAKQLEVLRYASVQEMLASSSKPDAAIVCTPNHTHVSVSKELLDGDVHVLCEKPISVDVPSGQDLVNHAASLNLHLLVGHHRRFNRYIVTTKRLLSSHSLGRIVAVSGLWTLYKPPPYFDAPTEWRRTSSGGPILINLIHEIDILHHLLGPIVRVSAEATPSQRGHEAEEGAAILLRFASGAVGTFVLSDAVPSPYNFEAGTGENPTIPKMGQDIYRIFGTEACLSVPDMRIWSYGQGEKSWTSGMKEEVVSVEEMRMPFELQVEHLVRVVRGVEAPSCSGSDGLRAVVVCDAVKRALETGEAVDVPLGVDQRV
ncbi:hypothetical protein W97_04546 [Coniosporium apollinis CBS 100218]|uniref:Oxidoreductase n=1 Tax=Coniosporium apollinis (strain CBS 100218) TaxID=1168221 RepID=R7YTX7_CONA1|nr:uncharacterized protein W97_04546 [Coniosporium apollinis CBS 100218]EON65308.1 hypothetical protein W97_04546 [Coniosporium apollinis CBS 100218]